MNELGKLLKKLRGYNSLRTIAEKANNKISYTYLGRLEEGINPDTGQLIKPTPDKLKVLSDVYNYPYDKLLELAGYRDENDKKEKDIVDKLFTQYLKLSPEQQARFKEKILNKE